MSIAIKMLAAYVVIVLMLFTSLLLPVISDDRMTNDLKEDHTDGHSTDREGPESISNATEASSSSSSSSSSTSFKAVVHLARNKAIDGTSGISTKNIGTGVSNLHKINRNMSTATHNLNNLVDLRAYGGQVNTVTYNGNVYSTLADVTVDSSGFSTQNGYIALPSGWLLAPDNADSRSVIASHYWPTYGLCTVSGTSYCTPSYGYAGYVYAYNCFYQSGSAYAVANS
jgi:hypothetical protein